MATKILIPTPLRPYTDKQEAVEATGFVSYPTGDAVGERPVVVWAHGTSGLQQACLPSLAPDTSLWGKMSDSINAIAWGSGFGARKGDPAKRRAQPVVLRLPLRHAVVALPGF